MRRFFEYLRSGTRLCTRCVFTLVLWTAWLAMSLGLLFLIVVATNNELSLPSWVRLQLERRLADSAFRATFGTTTFDPSGRILIRDLVLTHPSIQEPLIEIRSAYLRLDPWWLLVGQLEPLEIEIEGAKLLLPSLLSPTGKSEESLTDASCLVHSDGSTFRIDSFSARLANLTITAQGAVKFPLPVPGGPRREMAARIDTATRRYLQVARELVALQYQLGRFESPRLHLDFIPRDRTIAEAKIQFSAARIRLPETWTQRLRGEAVAVGVLVTTRFPLAGIKPVRILTHFSAERIDAPLERSARALRGSLEGQLAPETFQFEARFLKASLASLEFPPWSATSLTVETPLPALEPALTARFAGEPWSVNVRALDLARGGADVSMKGAVSQSLLTLVGEAIERPLSRELRLGSRAEFSADVSLGAGWKANDVRGRLSVDAVTARTVDLDAASADFSYRGTSLAFTDIVLRQGSSLASGNYTMDTKTLDFRFLLSGRLQPAGIGGWFREWWPRFWSRFDFTASTPEASVDLRGRWGQPDGLTVFVAAENDRTGIRGTRFDRARTRLFIRPHFYDALHFHVVQANRHARGTFSRTVDLDRKDWSAMDFDAFSNLELAEGARVLGIEGLGIVEPFTFAEPPQLRLKGHLDGPSSPQGAHRAIEIAAYSTGGGSYYDFPLRDLSAIGTIKDDDIVLDPIATGFASGTAEGRIHLTGTGAERRLGFDFRLTRAVLGEAIRTLEEYGARSKKTSLPAQSRFQQRIASGRLDLAVSADGRFEDIFSYRGQGNAELTGADLGEVQLFGVLSQVLNGTLFNFSTLALDTVQTNFTVEGQRVAFSELRVSGPRAAIEAKGDYFLDRKTLDMKAKLYPFDESKFLLGSAVGFMLTPLSQAFEFKLTGQLDKPNWSFVYGPSNFFRSFRGENEKPSETAPTPSK